MGVEMGEVGHVVDSRLPIAEGGIRDPVIAAEIPSRWCRVGPG